MQHRPISRIYFSDTLHLSNRALNIIVFLRLIDLFIDFVSLLRFCLRKEQHISIDMVLERFLFPVPNPPHYSETSHMGLFFWLRPEQDSDEILDIPCMLYSPSKEAQRFIIWCHGNGCDIGSMHMTLTSISRRLQAQVLIFEYPSYGLLNKMPSPNKETINRHAERAYSYVCHTKKWPKNRIIIYEHSIGSGTACYLASTFEVGGLILQSPFTTISSIIQDKICFLSNFINMSFWDNQKAMERISCPTLFIHGKLDNLIKPKHSQTLYDSLNYSKKKIVILPHDDHNSISDPVLLIILEPFLNEHFPLNTAAMPQVSTDSALLE